MPALPSERYEFWSTDWNSGIPVAYLIGNAENRVIYVGESNDVKRRMEEHRANLSHAMHQYGPTYVWVEVITTGETARRARERALIAEYDPPANR